MTTLTSQCYMRRWAGAGHQPTAAIARREEALVCCHSHHLQLRVNWVMARSLTQFLPLSRVEDHSTSRGIGRNAGSGGGGENNGDKVGLLLSFIFFFGWDGPPRLLLGCHHCLRGCLLKCSY